VWNLFKRDFTGDRPDFLLETSVRGGLWWVLPSPLLWELFGSSKAAVMMPCRAA
jgi:hypothetical protein